jgi:pilus assembly protein FimV
MKFKFRFAGVALLAAAAAPAWALQLGQIQVKSALNQPLVAAIPLHPKNLTELEGLTVGLAPAEDFSRAGLQLTPTDRSLQFHVVTDNNGQKLILVTSGQPVTDPYLDFLVQVNTRRGKQVREFVVLLNPVIAAPAPGVQSAPVTGTPSARARTVQPAARTAQPAPQPARSLPPASAFPQPRVKSAPKPAAPARPTATPTPPPPPPPAPSPQAGTAQTGGTIPVARGDTLYGIAQKQTQGTRIGINQMMLALKTANSEAFFKNNINDLKAGAILRIPTRDEIDKVSIAEANAEVHRQYEVWRASRTHPATVVEGTAAEAAANAAPKPGSEAPASDHLALVPPSGEAGGASTRPGVAGGTGSETVTGLKQQLQNDRGALVSLNQSNADLESRVKSLKDISGKSDKLLSLKEATVAELQRKLAQVQSGKSGAAGTVSAAGAAAGASVVAHATLPKTKTSAPTRARARPAGAKPAASTTPWFMQPVIWGVAGLVVLALILLGLLRRRRGAAEVVATKGPLPDLVDVGPPPAAAQDEAALQAQLAENPDDLAAHLALCRLYYTQHDVGRFVAAAQTMRARVADSAGAEWHEVVVMGEELLPNDPLFAMPAEVRDDPYGVESLHQPVAATDADEATPAPPAAEFASGQATSAVEPTVPGRMEPDVEAVMAAWRAEPRAELAVTKPADKEPEFADDPVDTKLDLARAYLDMGDPVGARAMLEEVLEEGSQTQKNEAKRLLAEVAG